MPFRASLPAEQTVLLCQNNPDTAALALSLVIVAGERIVPAGDTLQAGVIVISIAHLVDSHAVRDGIRLVAAGKALFALHALQPDAVQIKDTLYASHAHRAGGEALNLAGAQADAVDAVLVYPCHLSSADIKGIGAHDGHGAHRGAVDLADLGKDAVGVAIACDVVQNQVADLSLCVGGVKLHHLFGEIHTGDAAGIDLDCSRLLVNIQDLHIVGQSIAADFGSRGIHLSRERGCRQTLGHSNRMRLAS